mmetsp:Transcript_40549/g.66623  ORF Transcript_40549/g.66623 Transcript_40549/m.66623 type:complete len:321 (-) Transcript_40549:138-1100(-)
MVRISIFIQQMNAQLSIVICYAKKLGTSRQIAFCCVVQVSRQSNGGTHWKERAIHNRLTQTIHLDRGKTQQLKLEVIQQSNADFGGQLSQNVSQNSPQRVLTPQHQFLQTNGPPHHAVLRDGKALKQFVEIDFFLLFFLLKRGQQVRCQVVRHIQFFLQDLRRRQTTVPIFHVLFDPLNALPFCRVLRQSSLKLCNIVDGDSFMFLLHKLVNLIILNISHDATDIQLDLRLIWRISRVLEMNFAVLEQLRLLQFDQLTANIPAIVRENLIVVRETDGRQPVLHMVWLPGLNVSSSDSAQHFRSKRGKRLKRVRATATTAA